MLTALALLITVAIEVPIVSAFYPGQRLRMALACALATTATNLFMNLVVVRVTPNYASYVAVGETVALVSEAAVYAVIARPRDVARAIAASGAANLSSFVVGLLLLP